MKDYYANVSPQIFPLAEEAGLPVVFTDWIPNSRRALEASEFARKQGKYDEFHQVVFRKFFGEGQMINEWTVLHTAAEEVGLDGQAMQQATEAGQYVAVVSGHIDAANNLGVSALPAFVFNDQHMLIGLQPYEILHHIATLVGRGRCLLNSNTPLVGSDNIIY